MQIKSNGYWKDSGKNPVEDQMILDVRAIKGIVRFFLYDPRPLAVAAESPATGEVSKCETCIEIPFDKAKGLAEWILKQEAYWKTLE